jgi:hypothetical protein
MPRWQLCLASSPDLPIKKTAIATLYALVVKAGWQPGIIEE